MTVRGQIAVEFSMMVMLAFIFLVVVLVIATFYLEKSSHERSLKELEERAKMIQYELLLAASVEDGYRRSFTIPETIRGQQYLLSNSNTTLTLALSDGTTINKQIPLVSGTLKKGTNLVHKDGILFLN